ncbi:MAG: hypothetical protein ABI432_15995 [Flavobacteriales bacterium]
MLRVVHRRTLLIIVGALAVFSARAQGRDQPGALFDSLAVSGWYFNCTGRYTNVMATDVLLIGFGGGIVIDHWLEIGLAGAWSSSAIKNPAYENYLQGQTTANLQGLELRYGYGGVMVEPLILHRSAVHLGVPILVGMGSASYSYPSSNSGSDSNQRNRTEGQAFFVVEGGLELEVSVVRSLRIGVGGSYLYASDLELPNTAPDALRNFMARMSVTVGKF